jgi:uncharacterized damage-inducible protein DinB
MIDAIEKNLERGIKLLNSISDAEYSDTSVKPYHSSIGKHMRHILDVFSCIFNGLDSKKIDFSDRERNEMAENYTAAGIVYFEQIIAQLKNIDTDSLDDIVNVTDDLGLGNVSANYTLAGVLIQAHSHAIHHYASVGIIINQLGIELPDADFGYNPTTPKNVESY